jgi:hypothetical protein
MAGDMSDAYEDLLGDFSDVCDEVVELKRRAEAAEARVRALEETISGFLEDQTQDDLSGDFFVLYCDIEKLRAALDQKEARDGG